MFRELKKKEISKEHQKVMDELINEHIFARKTTGELVDAKNKFTQGDKGAIDTVIEKMRTLIEFYPNHIDKEDNNFFNPVMDYFTKEEQDGMLKEGQIYDRRMIHRKYNSLVKNYEAAREIPSKKQDDDWIQYI